MTGFMGMDPVQMREASRALRGDADTLDALQRKVQQYVSVAATYWDGPGSRKFTDLWTSRHRPAMVAARLSLLDLADAIDRNVAEQESASDSSSGGSSSVTSSGRTGHATPAAPVNAKSLYDFALAAYPGENTMPAGWRDASLDELEKFGIKPADFHQLNGLDARLTTDGNGHFVLAFAGTEWVSVDTLDDVTSAQSPLPAAQVMASVNLAKKISDRIGPDGNLTLTGHSLGGREAAVASIATGAPAVTFNAAGPTQGDILYARAAAGEHPQLGWLAPSATTNQSNITNYRTPGDPLTFIQEFSPLSNALGKQISVTGYKFFDHDLKGFDGKLD